MKRPAGLLILTLDQSGQHVSDLLLAGGRCVETTANLSEPSAHFVEAAAHFVEAAAHFAEAAAHFAKTGIKPRPHVSKILAHGVEHPSVV
ncbi:MAG: hypothetical protein J2P29_12130, partial [Actinobacteria bacterium]|nr:hypothetical protein [Actinomycetota bacterium]